MSKENKEITMLEKQIMKVNKKLVDNYAELILHNCTTISSHLSVRKSKELKPFFDYITDSALILAEISKEECSKRFQK